MQAIILAAGMGKRLGQLTENNTKCMIEVNNVKLIDRMISSLKNNNIEKIVIVAGYKSASLKQHVEQRWNSLNITFIDNIDFNKTNNIYSLYLAKDYLCSEDTILLESDLIFEDELIQKLIADKKKNSAIVSKYQDWMDGTVVDLDKNNIKSFILKKDQKNVKIEDYYKTVNIYKFSKEFSKDIYVPMLEVYCNSKNLNRYYEEALSIVSDINPNMLGAVTTDDILWYEIDNMNDYRSASTMFAREENIHNEYLSRYGGYWRFPSLLDYCYLVNPYFPTKDMLSEMSLKSDILISSYPSGLNVINQLAADIFNIDQEYITIGNGASELINIFLEEIKESRVAVFYPSFDEYKNRAIQNSCIVTEINSFSLTNEEIETEIVKSSINNDYIFFVNPENPTGRFIPTNIIKNILEKIKDSGCIFILDESFVDFSGMGSGTSMLHNDTLKEHKNLVLVKSISKSFGVPGIRLGLVASSNTKIIKKIKSKEPIWNINSYAEKFLELLITNMDSYWKACSMLANERSRFVKDLESLGLLVHNSSANFLLIDIIDNNKGVSFENFLLKNNILVKGLKNKQGINSNSLFRIAVKDLESNKYFYEVTKSFLKIEDAK